MKFVALLFLIVACGGEEAPPTLGTAELRYEISNGARRSRNLTDPLRGIIYGNIFLKQEVTLTGPIDGATEYQYVELAGVDLVAEGNTSQPFTTGELPAGDYTFLGFFDVDANGAQTKDPDSGDPVTLPNNQFRIVAGQKVSATISFDLIFN